MWAAGSLLRPFSDGKADISYCDDASKNSVAISYLCNILHAFAQY